MNQSLSLCLHFFFQFKCTWANKRRPGEGNSLQCDGNYEWHWTCSLLALTSQRSRFFTETGRAPGSTRNLPEHNTSPASSQSKSLLTGPAGINAPEVVHSTYGECVRAVNHSVKGTTRKCIRVEVYYQTGDSLTGCALLPCQTEFRVHNCEMIQLNCQLRVFIECVMFSFK